MKLTKEDKESIIRGLINERSKNSLIIEAEQKKIENNSNSWKEVKDWTKDSHIINFYKKEDKRIKDLMIMFGYKEIDICDADDDSYESGKADIEAQNDELEKQIDD